MENPSRSRTAGDVAVVMLVSGICLSLVAGSAASGTRSPFRASSSLACSEAGSTQQPANGWHRGANRRVRADYFQTVNAAWAVPLPPWRRADRAVGRATVRPER